MLHAQVPDGAQISIEPATPAAYQPFKLRVRFASPNCWSTTSPVFSDVSFRQNVLRLTLSHLKPGPCAEERVYPVSGLPEGNHSVVLQASYRAPISPQYSTGITLSNEIGRTQVTVTPIPSLQSSYFYTGRIDGDSVFRPFAPTEGGGGPVVLWLDHGTTFGSGNGDWLEVGPPDDGGYTFKFLRGSPSTPPPEPYEPLYVFRYPLPAQGVIASTGDECVQLLRTWLALPQSTTCGSTYFVLKLRNGACPLGATPVYRLFHPVSVAHRYTQSAQTYAELQHYGYVGEGARFCAPARD
jgi:hypothetical protein